MGGLSTVSPAKVSAITHRAAGDVLAQAYLGRRVAADHSSKGRISAPSLRTCPFFFWPIFCAMEGRMRERRRLDTPPNIERGAFLVCSAAIHSGDASVRRYSLSLCLSLTRCDQANASACVLRRPSKSPKRQSCIASAITHALIASNNG